jgi:hypothetical protein
MRKLQQMRVGCGSSYQESTSSMQSFSSSAALRVLTAARSRKLRAAHLASLLLSVLQQLLCSSCSQPAPGTEPACRCLCMCCCMQSVRLRMKGRRPLGAARHCTATRPLYARTRARLAAQHLPEQAVMFLASDFAGQGLAGQP